MPNYRLYSRQNGYEHGNPVKFFYSELIKDVHNQTKTFVDRPSTYILQKLSEITDLKLRKKIRKLCQTYTRFYYYPEDTIIKDKRIF